VDGQRDQGAVRKYIERLALALSEAGIPRMPARVFSALLVTDSGRLTAGELADLLQVSPAAVSGAVRYLTQVYLVTKEREPGSRRDHYRLYEDPWYEATVRKNTVLHRWEETAREGLAVLGSESPAGARMAESLAFFEFVHKETPELLTRWREHKAALFGSEESA
jgi:DNA-binding transcriptional regulator GbsR (MarR family)